MQSFTMRITQDLVISSNRRAETWLRKRVKDALKPQAHTLGLSLAPMGKATIYVGITKRTRGKYDPVNLSDTFKPVIDGLVTAGVLDDDDYEHVLGPFCFHQGVDKSLVKSIGATVYLTEYSPTPF